MVKLRGCEVKSLGELSKSCGDLNKNKRVVVVVNFNVLKSIKNAEKLKERLENKGFNLEKTTKFGIDKFKLIYKK